MRKLKLEYSYLVRDKRIPSYSSYPIDTDGQLEKAVTDALAQITNKIKNPGFQMKLEIG